MHEEKSSIFEIERKISVTAIRVSQQRRFIDGLPEGPERIEALSAYAELLRAEHELEEHRAKLTRQLSKYKLTRTGSGP